MKIYLGFATAGYSIKKNGVRFFEQLCTVIMGLLLVGPQLFLSLDSWKSILSIAGVFPVLRYFGTAAA